jgi:hypothetical protein
MTFMGSPASPSSECGASQLGTLQVDATFAVATAQGDLEPPPGLAGVVAQFIYSHAPYPNPMVAVCGSLALLSALFGRAFNVSGTGLNIWIAIVGGTGIGKEAAQSGIAKIVSAVAEDVPVIMEFIGASSWASPEAVHKRLAKTPSVLGFIGELGIKLKVWCSPKASLVHAGLVAFFLDVYGKSGRGNRLEARENSDREKGACAVESPSLALLGDTTETTLLPALTEELVSNGFAPRWIPAFAGDQRGPLNRERQLDPPEFLIEQIKSAAARCAPRSAPITDVPLSVDAQAIDDEIEAFTSRNVNCSDGEIFRHLWSRARLNILKVAALIAIGDCGTGNPIIQAAHITWARRFVIAGVERILSKFERGEVGEVGGNQVRQQNEVLRIIKDYFQNYARLERYHPYRRTHEFWEKGIITFAHIHQRLANTAAFKNDPLKSLKALERTVRFLLETDVIREVPPTQMAATFGSKPRAFVMAEPDIILKGLNR